MISFTQEQLVFGAAIALAVVCLITIILLIITLCKLKKVNRRIDTLTRGKDNGEYFNRFSDTDSNDITCSYLCSNHNFINYNFM